MIDESCYPSRLAVHNIITSCLEQKCLSLEDKKISTIDHPTLVCWHFRRGLQNFLLSQIE